MQIIKNLLYIVSFLCIGNVFAMQEDISVAKFLDKPGIYVFNDGFVYKVSIYENGSEYTVAIGQIKDNRQYNFENLYKGNSLQECFNKFTKENYEVMKKYTKSDIVFVHEGRYIIGVIQEILDKENVSQKIEDNRKKIEENKIKEAEKYKEALEKENNAKVTLEKEKATLVEITENAKLKIQANMNRNLLFTSVVVSGVLGFVSYIIYKKYKAKQNKTNDLAKTDEVNNEEDNMPVLEELKEKDIQIKEEKNI